MKLARVLWLAMVVACIASHPALADWDLTTADRKTQKNVGINEWSIEDGLSYTESGGALKTAVTRQIVLLAGDKPPVAQAAPWTLSLRNGDVLFGEPVSLTQGKLQFRVPDAGTISVPLKLVAILQSTDNKTPSAETPLDRDLIRFKNGDTLDGVFVGLANGKAQIQHEDTTTAADLARIDRLSLGGAVPARALPALSVRLTLRSGTLLTTSSIHWKVAQVTLKDYSGADITFGVDQIKSVDVLGGQVVWLTDIDPARTQQTSYLGAGWPMQVNACVMGGPLKIANVKYDRGIGVHTNSTLEYNLDGTFTQLGFSVGMDDSAAPSGQADVKVLIDGKVAWEQDGLKAGRPAMEKMIDVKGAHKVELIAASPGTMDVLGRVDWGNIALIRP